MHRLPLLSRSLLICLVGYSVTPLFSQALREDAINRPTQVSPSNFRPIQSLPQSERGADALLLAQNIPQPPPLPEGLPTPPLPPDGGPPMGLDGGPPMGGPGGFRNGGGRGGFRGGPPSGEGIENFKIEGDKVSLQFPNNTIIDILGIYERLTKKTLIKDTTIFEGQPISLVTPEPVSVQDAIRLIEESLLTNGYAIIADQNGKSARILPTKTQGASTAQFSQGVRFYQSAADLPNSETLVSYFMKLEYLEPELAAQMLSNHIGLGVYGRITAVTSPPGLLISENANIVRQLVSIKEVIDQPDTAKSLVTKFVKLKYADASTVAQIIQSTLEAQASDAQEKGLTTIRGGAPGGGGGQQQPPQMGGQPQTRSQGNNSQQGNQSNNQRITPKPRVSAQVVADSRLNQVLIVAEPEDYAYIISLVTEMDQVVDIPDAYERKLKNVYSVDVVSVLADLLKETTTGTTQLPGGGTLSQNNQPLTSSSSQLLTGRTGNNSRGGSFSNSTSGSSDSSSGVASRPDELVEAEEDNAPISVLVGKTRIIADPLSNSIIVIGSKEDKDKVDMLLEKLDRKPPQVYLATVIGQLTLGDDYQFGIDYLQKFTSTGSNSGLTSALIATREDIVTNSNVTDMTSNAITSAIANAKGFNIYGQIGDTVDAFVNALEKTSKFKILSRPSVFALNNKKAVITSGQSIPVPSQSLTNASSNTNNNSGNVTTTIEYKDVVLKLEVIPLINPDGNVTLKIAQINDSVTGNQSVSGNSVPIIGTEQLKTTATVPTGSTIVLGGLITEQNNVTTEGIPVISRIPLVGRLFKEDVTSKQRKELIIFIQPIVVDDEQMMQRASLNEDLRTQVGQDAYTVFPDKVIPKAVSADAPPTYGRTPPSRPSSEPSSSAEPEKKRRWFNFKKSDKPSSASRQP